MDPRNLGIGGEAHSTRRRRCGESMNMLRRAVHEGDENSDRGVPGGYLKYDDKEDSLYAA